MQRVETTVRPSAELAATGQPLDLPAAGQPALDNPGDLGVLCSRLGQDHHSDLMGCINGHRHLFFEAERACATRQ